MNTKEREDSLTLGILETIDQQDNVTQRHLADRLGVALGLANAYLKRCVRKGLVKIHQVPANRYLYYLTPKGFAEKSRLTAQYLSASFDFYRRAGDSLKQIYQECEKQHIRRILFCGVSELAEIASIRAHEHNITIVGTWDPDSAKKSFLHRPVWRALNEADQFDACLITSLDRAQEYYDQLVAAVDREKIQVPSILGINHSSENNGVLSPLRGDDTGEGENRVSSPLRRKGEDGGAL